LAQKTQSPPRLGFFKITVADAEKSQRFYEEAFGMVLEDKVVEPTFSEHMLKTPDKAFTLVLLQRNSDEPISNGNGYGPIGFFIDDLESAAKVAVAAGAKVVRGPETFGTISFAFLASPDGHIIELIDRPV